MEAAKLRDVGNRGGAGSELLDDAELAVGLEHDRADIVNAVNVLVPNGRPHIRFGMGHLESDDELQTD
ncbi:hypothetical protein [Bradyrhizobium guangxiense]|uniref:hypothetical protein n=1 Tax=Bradyrhizobium guangxiense TaxID=1325115 RepID=UPI001009176A|nr:hypothetical protein [Bradyrhizobium guangxiense]